MKSEKTHKAVRRPATETPVPEEGQHRANNRRIWYIALLIAGLLVLGGTAALAVTGVLDGLERRAFAAINHVYLPGWVGEQVAKPISNAVWGIVFLVVVLLAVPKFRLLAWQYAVAGGAVYVAVTTVEHLVNRARPAGLEAYDAVLRASQDGLGFPSGHVAVLTVLGMTAWPLVSWPWRILVLVLVCAEAWSRIFLGVHAPLDVVGGVAVAAIVVGVIHLLPLKIRKIFKIAA